MDEVSTLCGTDRVLSVTLPTDGEILVLGFLDHRFCVSPLQIWSLRCMQAKGYVRTSLCGLFLIKLMYGTYLRARHFFCWPKRERIAVCQLLLQICGTAHLVLLDSTNIDTRPKTIESFQNVVYSKCCTSLGIHIRGLDTISDVVIILAPHELERCNQTEF